MPQAGDLFGALFDAFVRLLGDVPDIQPPKRATLGRMLLHLVFFVLVPCIILVSLLVLALA